jgi:hypothetical protein
MGTLKWRPTGGSMAEAQPQAKPQTTSVKFKDMTPKQKMVFVLKITVCIISGGMIYPNVMHD